MVKGLRVSQPRDGISMEEQSRSQRNAMVLNDVTGDVTGDVPGDVAGDVSDDPADRSNRRPQRVAPAVSGSPASGPVPDPASGGAQGTDGDSEPFRLKNAVPIRANGTGQSLNVLHVGPPSGDHDLIRWCMQDQIRILANNGLQNQLLVETQEELTWGRREKLPTDTVAPRRAVEAFPGQRITVAWQRRRHLFRYLERGRFTGLHVHGAWPVSPLLLRKALPRLPLFQTAYCPDDLSKNPDELSTVVQMGRIFTMGKALGRHATAQGTFPVPIDCRARAEHFDPSRIAPDRILRCLKEWRLDIALPPVALFAAEVVKLEDADFPLEVAECYGSLPATFVVMVARRDDIDFLPHLRELAKRKGLERRLHFVYSPNDPPAAYLAARLLIFDRLEEGAFLPALPNAISLGKLVVAGTCGDGPAWVSDKETGFCFTPRSIESCANAIERALQLQDSAYQAMTNLARARMPNEAKRQIALVRSLLEGYIAFAPQAFHRKPLMGGPAS